MFCGVRCRSDPVCATPEGAGWHVRHPPPHTHTHQLEPLGAVAKRHGVACQVALVAMRTTPGVCGTGSRAEAATTHTHTHTHTYTHTNTQTHTHEHTHTHTHTQLRQLRSGADCRATPHRCGVVHVANARLQWRTGALSRAHTTPAWPACRVRSGVWSKCAAALHSHVQSTTGWHGRVV